MAKQRTFTTAISADGDSPIYEVRDPNAQGSIEPVGYSISGTWGGATVTVYVCYNKTTSPLVFAPAANGAWTEDIGDKLDIPTGCYFKFTTSGSGSPIPALTLTVRGDIDEA